MAVEPSSDQELLNHLRRMGEDNLARMLISTPKTVTGLVSRAGEEAPVVFINPIILEENAGAIADLFIEEAEQLMAQNKVKEGFARFADGIRSLVQSIVRNNISLEVLIGRVDKYNVIVSKAAVALNARDYSIEIALGLSPSLNIAFHFKTPSALT